MDQVCSLVALKDLLVQGSMDVAICPEFHKSTETKPVVDHNNHAIIFLRYIIRVVIQWEKNSQIIEQVSKQQAVSGDSRRQLDLN